MPLIEFANGAFVPKNVTHATIAKHLYRPGWAIQVHFVSGESMREIVTDEDRAKHRFEGIKKQLKNHGG